MTLYLSQVWHNRKELSVTSWKMMQNANYKRNKHSEEGQYTVSMIALRKH